ncbi:MAG: DUF1592 domain-containing protein [Planctomycetaceae bacterium]
MNPSFSCDSCNFRFRVEERFLGRRIRCPNPQCKQPILLDPHAAPGDTRRSASGRSSLTAAPTAAPKSPSVAPAKLRTAAPVGNPPSSSVRTTTGSREGLPLKASPVATQSSGRSESESRSGGRAVVADRNVARSSATPLIIAFGATLVLGGIAVGGYWFWNQQADVTTVRANDESTATGADNSPPDSGKPQSPSSAVADNATSLAAATPTASVSDAVLRQHAARQQKLEEKVLPFLKTHCADCHSAESQEGGIVTDGLFTVNQLLKERKTWERVYRMINAGAMPPADYDAQPTDDIRKEVTEIFYDELYNFDCTQIHHAGRATLHRLNRAEYNNTIRDLFGISLTPADDFPQDDVGEGFDNIGDVLSVPPLLMEKYLDAAEQVAAAVIDTRDFSKGLTQTFNADRTESTAGGDPEGEGFRMLGSTGSVSATVETSSEGKYKIRIRAQATQAGDEDAKMALQIDGQNVTEFEVKGHRKANWFEHDVTLSAGSHKIGGAFLNDFYHPEAEDKRRRDRNLAIGTIEVIGPEGGPPAWHETHRRFTVRPSEGVSVKDAASQVLRPILYRAFRRPVTDTEVIRFAELVDRNVTEFKETYDYGLYVALQAALVSPDFLFRKEADPEGDAAERKLNEYEVASRLSYFLWSSMPDDELFQLAENKRLFDPAILQAQIERMLHDEKAKALSRNFAAQWLNLRNLADVRPNPELFPDFDEALRSAMSQETELLFSTIVKENRSIDDFLNADFTFLNERLAKHYGIAGVTGEEFVRVSLEGTKRSGLLTQASILTLTSNPGRTSPVKRGKWILENILGESPPPPPPGVPPLEEATKDVSDLSLRERLEIHRKDPGCASCHKTMDPLGMGLENFDAVGRWRDKEGERDVDSTGELPSGEKFSGPIELIGIIRGRQEQFHRAFAERLLTYALGRGLEYYDKCAVDQALVLMKQRGNRFSALVEGIVTSDPFMKRSRLRELDPAH